MIRRIACVALAVSMVPANAVLADPLFGLPAEVELEPGMSVVVPVMGMGSGETIWGMELFVELDAPIELTNIDLHSGTIWGPGNPVVLQVCTYFDCPDPGSGTIWDPQHGFASVSLMNPIVMPASGLVANLTISAPADTPIGATSLLELAWPDEGLFSGFLPEQVGIPPILPTSLIRVVPEPATALLLLAAGWPLRRRRPR